MIIKSGLAGLGILLIILGWAISYFIIPFGAIALLASWWINR